MILKIIILHYLVSYCPNFEIIEIDSIDVQTGRVDKFGNRHCFNLISKC